MNEEERIGEESIGRNFKVLYLDGPRKLTK
jgi:hypothetical protein